jgi:hypothetical protein
MTISPTRTTPSSVRQRNSHALLVTTTSPCSPRSAVTATLHYDEAAAKASRFGKSSSRAG